MVNDDDILEKEDMYILDKIREFCVKAESTASVAAAKQLGVLIDRVVCQAAFPCIPTELTVRN